jgi:hypothetical protein
LCVNHTVLAGWQQGRKGNSPVNKKTAAQSLRQKRATSERVRLVLARRASGGGRWARVCVIVGAASRGQVCLQTLGERGGRSKTRLQELAAGERPAGAEADALRVRAGLGAKAATRLGRAGLLEGSSWEGSLSPSLCAFFEELARAVAGSKARLRIKKQEVPCVALLVISAKQQGQRRRAVCAVLQAPHVPGWQSPA